MDIYLYKKIPPPPYMREVVDYHPAPTPSFSLSFFSTLAPLLRFARTVISYLYLSPPTTYTPPSSRRTTGIISVFPQTRLTRNVVQQALRALSTGRDILLLPVSFCLARSSFGFRLDSTSSIDNSRLILRESGLLPCRPEAASSSRRISWQPIISLYLKSETRERGKKGCAFLAANSDSNRRESRSNGLKLPMITSGGFCGSRLSIPLTSV